MKVNNNKKGSNARKLIPAVGMLSVSAVMLATSTYAWFTMSREVEVKNIQMMATVPEDIQISLGAIGADNDTAGTAESSGTLTASTGVLVTKKQGSTDLVGGVAPPISTWDWSNTADISAYYQFGRLIPASSNTGENIYFTPDAAGVGRTLKDGAAFYQAAAKTAAYKYQAASGSGATATPATFVTGGTSGDASAMATAHVVTAKSGATVSDAWSTAKNTGGTAVNYAKSTTWDNDLNDDGYYVDIPIWIRTSATGSTTLSVKGWVAPKSASSTAADSALTDDLYKAVRVAILDSSGAPSCKVSGAGSILPLADGMKSNMKQLADAPFDGTSILDAKNYTVTRDTGSSITDTDLYGRTDTTWATYTAYTPTNAIATLTGPTVTDGKKANEYGTATQLYIRVWLEGEDENCWNETAGQDWSINLKFEKLANTTS